MAENVVKAKSRAGAFDAAFQDQIESPQLDSAQAAAPAFNMPKMEVPASLREFAEAGISQTREVYERLKKSAEEATAMLEATCTKGGKGATDYGRKLLEITTVNANAAFEFADELIGVKSFSEMIQLTRKHALRQFDTLTDQTKELAGLARKVATETSEPIRKA